MREVRGFDLSRVLLQCHEAISTFSFHIFRSALLVPDGPVEHAVGDEALLGVEVLVVVGPHHAVVVDHDAVLLQEEVDVRVEPLLAALAYEKSHKMKYYKKKLFQK